MAFSINSICVSLVPDVLLDCLGEGGDFPYYSFRYYSRFDESALPRECVEVRPASQDNGQPYEVGFGSQSLVCSQALWIDLPDHLTYEESREVYRIASVFFRAWALGRLAGVPANV